MGKANKRGRGKSFGGRQQKPVELEINVENERPLRPELTVSNWLGMAQDRVMRQPTAATWKITIKPDWLKLSDLLLRADYSFPGPS
jgi:hypothetical protein